MRKLRLLLPAIPLPIRRTPEELFGEAGVLQCREAKSHPPTTVTTMTESKVYKMIACDECAKQGKVTKGGKVMLFLPNDERYGIDLCPQCTAKLVEEIQELHPALTKLPKPQFRER